jgi:prolyl 4-hydroxylase
MDEAGLSELRRRCEDGDTEAQLALGTRLLTGDGVPPDTQQGAALVERACQAGNADAANLLATMEAMGAGRPQSWQRAFDWLLLAAERGHEGARAQLLLLNRDPSLAGEQEDDGLWKRIRERLDLAALTAAPAKRSLCDGPRIRVIEGFASKSECDWAMARARGGLKRAMVLDQQSGRELAHPDRTNRSVTLNLIELDVVLQILRARIGAATNLPVPVFEPAQIMHYSVGEEFRPHFDFDSEQGYGGQLQRYGQRIATFLLYLNGDFEGGETEFPKIDVRYRGGQGDAIFFANVDRSNAPDPLTLHAGRPPVRGEKWILSQWIRDRTPAPA